MKYFIVFALIQVLQQAACIEMPPFNVINSTEKYEERMYPAKKWASTEGTGSSNDLFNKLFNYIDGQNEAGVKIDMTAPVTILYVPCQQENCPANYTMSFYVPDVHQDQPPKPSNADVFIEDRPQLHIFSRRFHGFASEHDYLENAKILHDDLGAAGVAGVNYDYMYNVGYDSPFVIVGRNNEVWFVKEDA